MNVSAKRETRSDKAKRLRDNNVAKDVGLAFQFLEFCEAFGQVNLIRFTS